MLLVTGLAFLMAANSIPGEAAAAPSVEMTFGRNVADRALTDEISSDAPLAPGERVYAYTVISPAQTGFIQHVWWRDGAEVARHDLPVGVGRRWRTWSRHKVLAGSYKVQVLAADGAVLLEKTFTVEPSLEH